MTSSPECYLALWRPTTGAGMPRAEMVGKVEPDGSITPVDHRLQIAVLATAMLDAAVDTLWSVRVQERHGHALASPPSFPPAAALPLNKYVERPRLDYELPASLKKTIPARISTDLRPNGGHGHRTGRQAGRGDSQRSAKADMSGDGAEPIRFAAEATPCTTGLSIDAGEANDVRRRLDGEGIVVELSRAPDFVGLGGGLWIRSKDWPVVKGRLKAPTQPIRRIMEVVRLPSGEATLVGRVLGLCILPAAILRAKVERFEDWRTDDDVLSDASDLSQLLKDDPANTIAADLEGLAERLGTGGGLRDEADRFRLHRIIEVARRRASIPRDLAGFLPGIGGLDELLAAEKERRRQTIRDELESEFAAERARLTSTLEGLRNDLTEAERALPLMRERENEARRVFHELQAGINDMVERHFAQALSSSQHKIADIEQKLHRLEDLHTSTESIAADQEKTRAEIEALRGDLSSMEKLTVKAALALNTTTNDRLTAVPIPQGAPWPADRKQDQGDTVIQDCAVAVRGLHWLARWRGVNVGAVELGAVAAVAGITPLFVGPRANAAAVALAEALAGDAFEVLDCDPALLAVSDLLDPARARTEVFLRAVERARSRPERWHAVALRSVDWSPCGYWLPSLGRHGHASPRLPHNLAVLAATADDGPRTPVPTSALTSALPILVEPWAGRSDAKRTTSPWATELTTEADPARVLEFESEIAIVAQGADGEVRSLMTAAALAGHRLFGWDAQHAADVLSTVAEVAAMARLGAPATDRVRSLVAILSTDGAP